MTLLLLASQAWAVIPVGSWRGEGNGADAVGTFTATIGAGTTWPSSAVTLGFGLPGQIAAGGSVPDALGLDLIDDLSISAWVNPSAVTSMTVLCKWGASGDRSYCLSLEPVGGVLKARFEIATSTTQTSTAFQRLDSTASIPINTWTHVAAVLDSGVVTSTRKIYVNGVWSSPAKNDVGPIVVKAGAAPLGIGKRITAANVASVPFSGAIDELWLYSGPLTQTEVTALYDLDGDGLAHPADPDDDGDGVLDAPDTHPLDARKCQDVDLDQCDDCTNTNRAPTNDGFDTDADGFCNRVDPLLEASIYLDAGDLLWANGSGTGSPTVVRDTGGSNLMVMIFEAYLGPRPGCPDGAWGLGMATSGTGAVWVDLGGILLSPQAGTYYSCVAAHPTVVDRFPGTLVVFFKAEQGTDACASGQPSWGCSRYTGVGRAVLTWNGLLGLYQLTPPDPTPVLSDLVDFGYPKVVHQGGQYHMMFGQNPDIYGAKGTASFGAPFGPVVAAGDFPWGMDEMLSPALVCNPGGGQTMYVVGRNETPPSSAIGRLDSTNGIDFVPGPNPLMGTATGDPDLRHVDVLPVDEGDDIVLFSDDRDGTGSTNRIRIASTEPLWSLDLESRVCP